eukprot:4081030-Prymnesium_polylepis.2
MSWARIAQVTQAVAHRIARASGTGCSGATRWIDGWVSYGAASAWCVHTCVSSSLCSMKSGRLPMTMSRSQ